MRQQVQPSVEKIPAAPLAVWQHQSEPEGLTDLLNLSHNALDTEDEEMTRSIGFQHEVK